MKKSLPIVAKVLLFILCVGILYSYISCRPLDIIDEVWNYGFARSIYDGLTPYKDFNMIIFPLFAFLMAPFSSEFMIYRLATSVLNVALMFLAIHIVQKYSTHKVIAIPLIAFFSLFKYCFPLATYSEMMYLFIILSFLYLKKYLDIQNPKNLFLAALFISLALITKHSVPAIIIIGMTPAIFYLCWKNRNIKDFMLYALGGVLPVLALIVHAVANGYLLEMIDLTIMGIGEFSTVSSQNWIFYLCIIACILFVLLLMLDKILNKTKLLHSYLVAVFALSSYFFFAPLPDIYHPCLAIFVMCSILSTVEAKFFIKELFLSGAMVLLSIFLLFPIASSYSIPETEYSCWECFENVPLEPRFINNHTAAISLIQKYRDMGFDVANCSLNAMTTSLIMEEHNGYFDLLMKGNLGIEGKKKVFAALGDKDVVIVLKDDSEWHTVLDYIKDTFVQIDSLVTDTVEYEIFVKPDVLASINT